MTKNLLRTVTISSVFIGLVSAQLSVLQAGFIGPIAGQNSLAVSATIGGPFPQPNSPPLRVPRYPQIASFAVIDDTEQHAHVDIAYQIDPVGASDDIRHFDAVNVFSPDTASPTQAVQGPSRSANGPLSMETAFTIRFQVDAAGTMATQLPIEYPISYLSTAADTAVSFDIVTNYSSQALGPLGVSELHFARSGIGSLPITWFAGPTLNLPALPANDILTLTGTMSVMADGSPNGRAEIYVYGVPEPSTFMLLGLAIGGFYFCIRWQRAKSRACVATAARLTFGPAGSA
jgi:hypothetical protein